MRADYSSQDVKGNLYTKRANNKQSVN